MADKEIGTLTAAGALDGTEIVHGVQAGNSRKITTQAIANLANDAAWALAGTGQTATGVYDFAVDGAKANIDFIGLSSFNELLVIARNLTDGTSGTRCLRVSVDNGGTFFASAGDYKFVLNTGAESNASAFATHDTNSTAARGFAAHILNMKGAVKLCQMNINTVNITIFDASTSDINAVRITNVGGGNITGGTVRIFAR